MIIRAITTYIEKRKLRSTLHKIDTLIIKISKHDWATFNTLNMMDQLGNINPLFRAFEDIVKAHTPINDLFLKEVERVIDTHKENFKKLYIKGGAKFIFYSSMDDGKGGIHILERLFIKLHDIHYEDQKKQSTLDCDCQLALKFKKEPEFSNLKNIAWINDRYYFPEVYVCQKCNFKWVSEIIDDDIGGSSWEQYSSENDSFIVYY